MKPDLELEALADFYMNMAWRWLCNKEFSVKCADDVISMYQNSIIGERYENSAMLKKYFEEARRIKAILNMPKPRLRLKLVID